MHRDGRSGLDDPRVPGPQLSHLLHCCQDEFNENPEKYIKKAALMAGQGGKSKTDQPAPSRVSRFEDAFAGDVVDSAVALRCKVCSASSPEASRPGAGKASDETASTDEKPAARPAAKTKGEPDTRHKGGRTRRHLAPSRPIL